MYNPFGMGSARQGFGQQGSNQPYDFKGLESRLGKIETGIAGLTEQFGNFQMPGQGTVQPEYTGNTAPDPLTTAAPTGGIQSLPEAQPAQASGQELSRTRGPLSLTEKLRNEYRTETGGPLYMGEEWDARQKEMGFDFGTYGDDSRGQYLKDGEWTNAPIDWYSKGHEKYKPGGVSRLNQLFEEAGGVLDRPTHGAAARYGEGFTNWLSGKGYEMYTEKDYRTEPGYQSQQGLGELMGGPQQDMSWYTPHLSQYAMTAEEMQDPEGTLKARRNEQALNWPSVSDTGGSPGLEGIRGGKLNPELNNWSDWQQQGIPIGLGGGRERPGWTGQPQQLQSLQAGVGSLQGPTQQKIKQGYQV